MTAKSANPPGHHDDPGDWGHDEQDAPDQREDGAECEESTCRASDADGRTAESMSTPVTIAHAALR